jgi:hypothetical protein
MADRIRELFRVDAHRALVTGASSGLGQRFALTGRGRCRGRRRRAPHRQAGRPGAGDAGAHMTGAVLAVDGGHLVSSL